MFTAYAWHLHAGLPGLGAARGLMERFSAREEGAGLRAKLRKRWRKNRV